MEPICQNEEIPNRSLGGIIIFNMKKPVAPFIGRERQLEQLGNDGTVAIVGPAGVGKTELARKHASDSIGSDTIWIDATDYTTLTHSFTDLALFVNISVSEKASSDIIRDVFRHFRYKRAVFYFDNALNDNYVVNNLEKFRDEPTAARIIITSRNDQPKFRTVELPPFTVTESIEFVRRNIIVEDESDEDLGKFATVLHNIPLALSKSTKYVKDKNVREVYTIRNFLDDYERAERSRLNKEIEEALSLETRNQQRRPDGDVLAGLRPEKVVYEVLVEPPTNGQIRRVVLGKIEKEAGRVATQIETETRKKTKRVRNFFQKLRNDLL